jgi:circadian clock protein KaiC
MDQNTAKAETTSAKAETNSAKAKTGIEGLDDVLAGGYARGHVYLLEGEPGAGKTTLGLQFLLDGARAGERCLYITLSETEAELREGAASLGWSLDSNIEVCELLPPESLLAGEQHQSLLYVSDLELGETTNQIFEAVKRVNPSRLGITVLLLDDLTSDATDKTVHSIAHGVIRLEDSAPAYGAERRRMRVVKYRGQKYRGPVPSGRSRLSWRRSRPGRTCRSSCSPIAEEGPNAILPLCASPRCSAT